MKQWGRSLALRSTRAMSIGAQAPWASLAKRICALLAPSIGNPVWLDSYLRSPSGPKIWLVLVPVLYLLVSAYMYSRQTHKVRLDSLFQADKPSPVRLLEQLLRPLLRHHHDPILSNIRRLLPKDPNDLPEGARRGHPEYPLAGYLGIGERDDVQLGIVLDVDVVLRLETVECGVVLFPQVLDPFGGGWVALVGGTEDRPEIGVGVD
jgi:hypothetical protein